MRRVRPPAECPVCGADVPANAHACPECGADERTGWDEEKTRYDGLDLPETAFREDQDEKKQPHRGIFTRTASIFWVVVGVVVTVALAYLVLRVGT